MTIKMRIMKSEVRNYITKILKKHDITYRHWYTSTNRVKILYVTSSQDTLEKIFKKQLKKEQVEIKSFVENQTHEDEDV